MGLLDALQSPDGQLGLGLLAAAGPSATPMSFGQRLSGAMQQFQAAKIAEEERRQKAAMQALQARLIESQIGETQAQALQRQAAAQEAQRKAAEAVRAKEEQDRFLSNPFKTQVAGGSFMTGSGERSPVENEQVQSASLRSARPVFDYASAARVFGTEGATKLMQGLNESRNFGLDEVARTADSAQGNRPGTIQLDKYGRTVGSFIPKAVEMKLADLGGTTQAYNPYELSNGQSFKKTQTADSVASNALGWSRLAWDKQKDARDAAAGQLVETPDGYVRVGKDNTSSVVLAPGGGKQLLGKGSNMTEDQGKATGWLVQAENAYKNMRAAGFDKDGNPKSAASPGPADVLEKVPLIGGTANAFRSADRQKFLQASSAMSESLLRAATGAGIAAFEAKQKADELTPKWGESPETTAQKMAAIPLYIETLKVRAGPGAAKAAQLGGANTNFVGAVPSMKNITVEW